MESTNAELTDSWYQANKQKVQNRLTI